MSETQTLGELVDAGAPTPVAFDLVVRLCERKEWMPVGFRRIELSDGFAVTVNGTNAPRKDAEGIEIPPFHASVSRNGWPCGIFTMVGGTLLAGVEDPLIAALQRAVDEAQALSNDARPERPLQTQKNERL